jgi:hypothetical protein
MSFWSIPAMPRRFWPPSWLISAILHAAALVVAALLLDSAARTGAAPERTAEVGIVLTHSDGEQDYFEGPQQQGAAEAAAADSASTGAAVARLADECPPSDPSDALPEATPRLGPGDLEGGGVGSAGSTARRSGAGTGREVGGQARTSVFGVEGEGYKFVYVFDRSASMGGPGYSPLAAAKAQLLTSLDSLAETHQFQIIFYNERPWKFNPTGNANRMIFATERNKELARRFVGGVTSDGATRHEDALLEALKLGPDVIFFLTDADEPKLWPAQLEKIRRRAGGVTINCIEFGLGPQQDPNNFLVRLAQQNGGRHAYVDTSRLSR